MGLFDSENVALYSPDATDIGLGSRLPDGLFGEGGQEGVIGFFSTERAGLARTTAPDTLTFGTIGNTFYGDNFGTAFLDDSMVPDGLFWDDTADPTNEEALVAWNDLAGGGWTYGNLDGPENIEARLEALAAALGVAVEDQDYASGNLVPAHIVAVAESNSLFSDGPIEDLRNANLNFTMTIGNLDDPAFVLRFVPQFAEIVEQTEADYQMRVAGQLDAIANIPYWDLGNSEVYQAAIDNLLELEAAERANALESLGFSFLPAFSSLGFEFSRDQIRNITDDFGSNLATSAAPEVSRGDTTSWEMGEDLYGLFALSGQSASYDASSQSTGYDVDLVSLTIGAEKVIDDAYSVGLVFSGTDGSADVDQGRGEIDASGLSVASFVRAQIGPKTMIQGVLGYQDMSYDTSSEVIGQIATGKTDGSQFFAALQGEHMISQGAFTYGPIASVEYYDIDVDGFDENGAGPHNLSIGAQSGSVLLGSIGMRGGRQLPDMLLTGELSYSVTSGDDISVQSGFVGLPGIGYPVAGFDEDWLDLALGVEAPVSENGSFTAGYLGSFRSKYDIHRLNVGLEFVF